VVVGEVGGVVVGRRVVVRGCSLAVGPITHRPLRQRLW
jgi:hypothetical protein